MQSTSPVAATAVIAALLCLGLPTADVHANAATPAAKTAKIGFELLKKRFADAEVVWKAGQPGAHVLTGLSVKTKGDSLQADALEKRARSFVRNHANLVMLGGSDLRYIETSRSKHRVVVRFQQTFNGRDVLDRIIAVRMQHDGTVLGLVSDAMPVTTVEKATITANRARRVAAAWTTMRDVDPSTLKVDAAILAMPSRTVTGRARAVWVVYVMAIPYRAHLRLIIDARDATVISARNLIRH